MQQVPYDDEKLYKRFLDGDLQNEFDEATIAHGYGTLSMGQSIGAFGPNYTCASLATPQATSPPELLQDEYVPPKAPPLQLLEQGDVSAAEGLVFFPQICCRQHRGSYLV